MLRRNFIKLSTSGFAAVIYSRLTYAAGSGTSLISYPDEAWAQISDQWIKLTSKSGSAFTYQDIKVEIQSHGKAQAVYVQSPLAELQAVKFKWKYQTGGYSKILGDHWERTYGDMAWRPPGERIRNPWYVLLHDDKRTVCFGVKTGGNSICWWEVKPGAVELTMDTRSGGAGVKLNNRTLHAADIITGMGKVGQTPYATLTDFCKLMCPNPRLPKQPVYGINDWYVVYGKNSFQTIKDQTAAMAELVTNTDNRPFSVIDDGWQQADDFSRVNNKFKDMHKMAEEIKRLGMRPGLWTRPLIARKDGNKAMLAPKIPGREQLDDLILDPTIPENLSIVKHNIKLYKEWGYDMVKHDFSSWDIFGRWGMQMKTGFTAPGWKFQNQSQTNAEIINTLYLTIREAADEMYIIGCNTMSHLSAGVFEINRIGDDTSGKDWARTKKMGVNTLGFRLSQNNTFYAADGDCVGLTKDVEWDKNKQWLQLLAESGSPLFISAELDILDNQKKAAINQAFSNAAILQPNGEPLDWITNPFPSKWKLNNKEITFNWD